MYLIYLHIFYVPMKLSWEKVDTVENFILESLICVVREKKSKRDILVQCEIKINAGNCKSRLFTDLLAYGCEDSILLKKKKKRKGEDWAVAVNNTSCNLQTLSSNLSVQFVVCFISIPVPNVLYVSTQRCQWHDRRGVYQSASSSIPHTSILFI